MKIGETVSSIGRRDGPGQGAERVHAVIKKLAGSQSASTANGLVLMFF